MADVCRTRGGALSPLSPNESRKRSRGSSGAQSSWFKRHRTGHSFARRLLHLRGFALDVRQAEELVRFIDQFPPEMDKVRPPRSRPPSLPRESPSVTKWTSTLANSQVAGNLKPRRSLFLPNNCLEPPPSSRDASLTRSAPSSRPQDVSNILEKCGDIDDAVRQLTTLRLSAAAASDDAEAAPNDASGAAGGDVAAAPAADAREAAEAVAAAGPKNDPNAALTAAEAEARAAAEASASAARLARAVPTTLSSGWVEALVREMSASSDVPDAHARAERVLQAFEATVRESVATNAARGGDNGANGASSGGGSAAPGGGDPAVLARENVILKRAVAIQNARQQEHEATRHQMVELQRAVLSYQERLQNAERQNYSLGVHLKEALGARSPGVFDRNPDVF